MLNRFKFPTRPGFVSFTQPDGKEVPPPSLDKSKNAPYLSTSKARVAVLTQLSDNEAGINQKDSEDEDLESEKIVAIPSYKEKVTSKDWLQKRSAREKEKAAFKNKFAKKLSMKEKKLLKFKPGRSVWSRHKSVSDFAPGDLPQKGKRRTMVKEIGTLLKKSAYYKDCWGSL